MSESQEAATERKRPAGVTFVVALTWLVAFGDLVASIWLLIVSFDKTLFATAPVGVEYVRYWALVALVVGVLTAVVAYALQSGSQFARVLVIIVMTLRIANALWALAAIRFVTLWPAIFDLALAIVIIALLTTGGASDYFRNRPRAATTDVGPQEPLNKEDQ